MSNQCSLVVIKIKCHICRSISQVRYPNINYDFVINIQRIYHRQSFFCNLHFKMKGSILTIPTEKKILTRQDQQVLIKHEKTIHCFPGFCFNRQTDLPVPIQSHLLHQIRRNKRWAPFSSSPTESAGVEILLWQEFKQRHRICVAAVCGSGF